LSRRQAAAQDRNVVAVHGCLENVTDFGYLGTVARDKICTDEEIESRLNLVNVFYYSVQNLLSSHLLSKNDKTTLYKTVILRVCLFRRET
jgi:hypothetical protein